MPNAGALSDASAAKAAGAADPPPVAPQPEEKTVAFSNLKKVYWPAERYTKGDLIEYYRAVSAGCYRTCATGRWCSHGTRTASTARSFYQKDAPEFAPRVDRTIPIWSEDTQREIRYFVCDDEETLLYIANMGSIPLHIWASRVGSLEQPDWCVIDLDPKEAPFSDVVRTAIVLRRLCESIELPNYVKTTGKTGLHILLPLGRQITYAQSRTLGELLRASVLRETPRLRDHHPARDEARRQGISRLPAEPARADDRGAVQRAPPAGRHGVDAARSGTR